MKIGIRFFVSWLLCAVTMFSLFYLWHGVFLNDLKRIQFPLSWFVTFAAFSYLIFSAGIYFLFESQIMKRFENVFVRGVVCGIVAGFSLFMIATVIHISLTRNLDMAHLMMNCVWQVSEQTIGVMVMVALKHLIRDPSLEEL
jgi:Na+/alanine symporter